ncbi:hypothetical protein BHE74_00007036 [Ensete ventricosum]|nr:hypothetical protein GW17_00050535 [Ensete ventricosum]RWW84361.1 hypothetical protein BHE74_00007036 [Ensete ventricosum]
MTVLHEGRRPQSSDGGESDLLERRPLLLRARTESPSRHGLESSSSISSSPAQGFAIGLLPMGSDFQAIPIIAIESVVLAGLFLLLLPPRGQGVKSSVPIPYGFDTHILMIWPSLLQL